MKITENLSIYALTLLGSIGVMLLIALQQNTLNPDGICYIAAAEHFQSLSLFNIIHLCPQANWPFYSWLIAKSHAILPFSYENTAYFLNTIFYLISAVAFLGMLTLTKANRRVLWFAAFLLIFSHPLNNVKPYIIRDHGYWAFYLLSLWGLLRYQQQQKLSDALWFGITLLSASLFRIEGFIFLITVPIAYALLINAPIKIRIYHFLKLNMIVIAAILMSVAYFAIHPERLPILSRLQEITAQFKESISLMVNHFQEMQQHLNTQLPKEARSQSVIIVGALFFILYFYHFINTVSLLYFIIFIGLVYCNMNKKMSSNAKIVLIYALINLFITSLFFAEHWFLSKRYLMGLTWLLLLSIPFGLDLIWQHRHQFPKISGIILIIFVVSAISGIHSFGPTKTHIEQAAQWLSVNVPKNAHFYANDYQLLYYSKHLDLDFFQLAPDYYDLAMKTKKEFAQYDYLALLVSHNSSFHIEPLIVNQFEPIKYFKNNRNDQVIIYKSKSLDK